jgi:hypothetical protein
MARRWGVVMAVNPDTGHSNLNTLYLACSGGGKSQALMQNPAIPKTGARVLLWDIDHDHAAYRFESMQRYRNAVIGGLKSGKGFRIAYSGADTVEAFEMFCRIAWACLDGQRKTWVIIEELADVTPSIGKASPEFGRLLRKGRKFGAELHITTQRGAEIPKTAYTQCPIKFVGQQEGGDIEKMARIAGVRPGQVQDLGKLEFWKKQAGPEPAVRVKYRYKKP